MSPLRRPLLPFNARTEINFDQESINKQLANANRAISALTAAAGGDVAVASRIVSKTERGEALEAIRRRTFSMLLQEGEPTIREDELEEVCVQTHVLTNWLKTEEKKKGGRGGRRRTGDAKMHLI